MGFILRRRKVFKIIKESIMNIRCPKCSKQFYSPRDYGRIKCTHCGNQLQIRSHDDDDNFLEAAVTAVVVDSIIDSVFDSGSSSSSDSGSSYDGGGGDFGGGGSSSDW